jgi:23S rRNA (pseudouridine1915-N3)-methyltransferase
MKISFWTIGKDHDAALKGAITDFTNRVSKYYSVEWKFIPSPKNAGSLPEAELKKREGASVLEMLNKDDYLVLLDERGKQLSSPELAVLLQSRANDSKRQLIFLIGGAFGVEEAVAARANFKWSLSSLTFPHQVVRLLLAEQVYRACTIQRNEKYHHS